MTQNEINKLRHQLNLWELSDKEIENIHNTFKEMAKNIIDWITDEKFSKL